MANQNYNSMCINCGKFGGECSGTTEKVWTGCVYRTVKETMSKNERNRVAGRFIKVSENPLVIGLIGNLIEKELTKAQIEHIKTFYGASGKTHEIAKDYPITTNKSMYNAFIIIK